MTDPSSPRPSAALRDLRVSDREVPGPVPVGDESPRIDGDTCELLGLERGTSFAQFKREELGPAGREQARRRAGEQVSR